MAAFYQSRSSSSKNAEENNQKLASAVKLYERALVIEPSNVMARHGLSSISLSSLSSLSPHPQEDTEEPNDIEVEGGFDPAYVTELFDSYSFHFEKSLEQLEYRSHLLVARAVGQYLDVRFSPNPSAIVDSDRVNSADIGTNSGRDANTDPISDANPSDGNSNGVCADVDSRYGDSSIGTDSSGDSSSDSNNIGNNFSSSNNFSALTILGLDLGAGTGLVCSPLKNEIEKNFKEYCRSKPNPSDKNNGKDNENDRLDGNPNSDSNLNPSLFAGPFVGMIGVDLSSKMLQKARVKDCYGDLIKDDVITFVQQYASSLSISMLQNNKVSVISIKIMEIVKLPLTSTDFNTKDQPISNPIYNPNSKPTLILTLILILCYRIP
jgi:hypothetical protein